MVSYNRHDLKSHDDDKTHSEKNVINIKFILNFLQKYYYELKVNSLSERITRVFFY